MRHRDELQRFESLTLFQGLFTSSPDVQELTDLLLGSVFHVPVHGLGVSVNLKQGRHERQGVGPQDGGVRLVSQVGVQPKAVLQNIIAEVRPPARNFRGFHPSLEPAGLRRSLFPVETDQVPDVAELGLAFGVLQAGKLGRGDERNVLDLSEALSGLAAPVAQDRGYSPPGAEWTADRWHRSAPGRDAATGRRSDSIDLRSAAGTCNPSLGFPYCNYTCWACISR